MHNKWFLLLTNPLNLRRKLKLGAKQSSKLQYPQSQLAGFHRILQFQKLPSLFYPVSKFYVPLSTVSSFTSGHFLINRCLFSFKAHLRSATWVLHSPFSRAEALRLWSPDRQHQEHMGTCWICQWVPICQWVRRSTGPKTLGIGWSGLYFVKHFFFFFNMDYTLKPLVNLLQHCFCFMFFFLAARQVGS